jgi:hypothetical protein
MIAAVIKDNLVVNIIVADANVDIPPQDSVFVNIDESLGVNIGATYEPSSGEFVNPSVEPETMGVPDSVTSRQIRLLLLSQGLLPQVTTMIEQQDEATKIAWEYSSNFFRNDPLLLSLAASLDLTQEDIDQFFIEASAL